MFVDAQVRRAEAVFVLTLKTEYQGHRSERRVEASRCADLGDSTALVVAIALEPELALGVSRDARIYPDDRSVPDAAADSRGPPPVDAIGGRSLETEAAAVREHRPRQAPPRAERTGNAPPERTRIAPPERVAVRLGPTLELGSLPRVGGGTELALALRWPRLRLEVRGTYLWPRRSNAPGPGSALYQLGTVGARGCARPSVRRLAIPLCLGLEAGALRVDSRGLSPPRTLIGPWFGPAAAAGVSIAGQRVGLWAVTEAGFAVVSTRILVGSDVAFAALPVSIRLTAGLEVFFSIDSPQAGQPR